MDDVILDPLVHRIASQLDRPSVYMGGPSHQSIRKAKHLIEALPELAIAERLSALEPEIDAWIGVADSGYATKHEIEAAALLRKIKEIIDHD